MSIIRTSRSRLMDRCVRVDRCREVSDGVGGMIEEYSTIIPRYWCTIWPPQHQQRLREELGEVADQTHVALADPARNGQTLMINDRFVDETNNECYKVLGVERPMGDSYNRMHRFPLRIVKDCPPPGS